MKNPDVKNISELIELPNIGKAIAAMLYMIQINKPTDLIGKEPLQLYRQLCDKSDKRIDPCVLDVFISAVHFMESGEAVSWWKFTEQRKQMLRSN